MKRTVGGERHGRQIIHGSQALMRELEGNLQNGLGEVRIEGKFVRPRGVVECEFAGPDQRFATILDDAPDAFGAKREQQIVLFGTGNSRRCPEDALSGGIDPRQRQFAQRRLRYRTAKILKVRLAIKLNENVAYDVLPQRKTTGRRFGSGIVSNGHGRILLPIRTMSSSLARTNLTGRARRACRQLWQCIREHRARALRIQDMPARAANPVGALASCRSSLSSVSNKRVLRRR